MNIDSFQKAFYKQFDENAREKPNYAHWDPHVMIELDPCVDVKGMVSIKKQQLLNLSFGLLDENEAYFEVGTYMGKSLLSAMLGNPERPVFACDNFSEFKDTGNSSSATAGNLERYGLNDKVTFFDGDFKEFCKPECLSAPIGLYFYDGAHDLDSQYEGIRMVERFLADEALVLVDDWRRAWDSGSLAKRGTMRAAKESTHTWELLHELPARFNGDRAMWWNGVGVLSFHRQ